MTPTKKSRRSFQEQLSSITEELLLSQDLAEQARDEGNQKLAARWHFLAELILSFHNYLHAAHPLSTVIEIVKKASINDRTLETQEIAEYTTTSLSALTTQNVLRAKQLMEYAQETRFVGIRSRHWLSIIQQEITRQESLKEPTASIYWINSSQAAEKGKMAIAQHWAEAACLLEEVSRKQSLGTEAYVSTGNNFLASHWHLSKNTSFQAAKLKSEVALALEKGDPSSAQNYDTLALLAEKLSCYEEHLIHAIIEGELSHLASWKSATSFLKLALDLALILQKARQETPSLPYQEWIVKMTEQVAEAHYELIQQLLKNQKTLRVGLSFAEKSFHHAAQALHFFEEASFSAAEKEKNLSQCYHQAYQLSKKASRSRIQWWKTCGCAFLYWNYRLKKTEKQFS